MGLRRCLTVLLLVVSTLGGQRASAQLTALTQTATSAPGSAA